MPVSSWVSLSGADEDGTLAITVADQVTTYKTYGYRWKNGVSTILPLPAGAIDSELSATRNGRVVGSVSSPDYKTVRAVLWDNDGTVKYLDQNAWLAWAINSSGLIRGVDQAEKDYLWLKTVRQQAIPTTAWHIYTITDGGILGGFGGPNLDKPIIMRCT